MNLPSAAAVLDFLNSPEAKASAEQYQSSLESLRLRSKGARQDLELERSRPAAAPPVDGVSVTLAAEPDGNQLEELK